MDPADAPRARPFFKLEALGNDFVLIVERDRSIRPGADAIRALADRRRGIGFDQLLLLRIDAHPPEVRIYNADGSAAEQCGNGMRALAAWLDGRGELPSDGLELGTPAGPVRLSRAEPIDGQAAWTAELPGLELGAGDEHRREVRLGNPHRVLCVPQPASAEVLLERVRREPGAADVNLGLACPIGEDRIALRVHERGAGPTPACGSGACAAAAALIDAGRVRAPVRIDQPGGSVVVDWLPGESRVRLTGPARVVFEGKIAWPNPNTAP